MITVNNGQLRAYNGEDGRFQQGNPGRPPGAVSQARKNLKDFLSAQTENLPLWFASLESDSQRLDYFVRLVPYFLPRLQAVTLTGDEEDGTNRLNLSRWNSEDLRTFLALKQKYDGD